MGKKSRSRKKKDVRAKKQSKRRNAVQLLAEETDDYRGVLDKEEIEFTPKVIETYGPQIEMDAGAPQFEGIELVFPFGMLSQIKDYLFNDRSKEYCCYLLCGHAQIDRKLRLLACYLVIPDESNYESHSIASVHIKQEFLIAILKECERLGLSLIDIHSHPFSRESVGFSGIDERDEQEKAKWFSENLPRSYYGSIVMGTNSHSARLRAGNSGILKLPLNIKSLEVPIRSMDSTSDYVTTKDEMFDRHILAFGKEGQRAIGNSHFAIVGLGGIGAGIAIGLARLGAKKFTLIDFDKAEITNLNRVAGMSEIDAKLNLAKVDVVARNLWQIDPQIQCERVFSNVINGNSWYQLRTVDLIVSATDTHISRMFLNRLSQLYLIPQVSAGTLISTNAGKLDGGHGHVYTVLPGTNQPCLLCAEIINPVEAYYDVAPEGHRRQAAKSGYIQGFDEPAPSVIHLNGVIINLALVEIHNLFCGFKPFSRHLVYSMLDQEIYSIGETERNCATCSQGGGIFGRGDLVDPLVDLIHASENVESEMSANSQTRQTRTDSE